MTTVWAALTTGRVHHWRALFCRQAVALEDLFDLPFLDVRNGLDLRLFAAPLARVVLRLASAGQVTAETHGDGACSNLGQAGSYHQVADGDRAGDAGREGKRHGEAVRNAHEHVANRVAGGEVLLGMFEVKVYSISQNKNALFGPRLKTGRVSATRAVSRPP
jgi:hypothetical protein